MSQLGLSLLTLTTLVAGNSAPSTGAELFVAGTTSDASQAPATSSESGGVITLTGNAANNARRDLQLTTLTAGRLYTIKFVASATVAFRIGTTQGGSEIASAVNATGYYITFFAGQSTVWLRWFHAAGDVRTVSQISIKAS